MFQGCYKGYTWVCQGGVLQKVLQGCSMGVIGGVTGVLQRLYRGVTLVLQLSYRDVTYL